MAPLKQAKPITSVTTRSRTMSVTQIRGKRKADCSPLKETTTKRSAFGDVTNAIAKSKLEDKSKKILKQPIATKKPKLLATVKTVIKPKQNAENLAPPQAPGINGIVTRATIKYQASSTNQTAVKPKQVASKDTARPKTRLSNEFEKSEESLYSSALEEIGRKKSSKSPEDVEASSPHPASVSMVVRDMETKLHLGNHEVPPGIDDFDKENWKDVFQVSHYAMDIFNYMRNREADFEIPDYMDRQICLNSWMRSLLVDWMVEVQESFELNHETLYLGVKLVDIYLSKMTVGKETLQLVGAAAMFIASKFDERIPPLIDDFLYICDGAYARRELVRMEINLLKICDFDLGIPISYRFLRRYARCSKITMPTLTLARYVLEYSLMDYATVTVRDSKLAAAALYLALQMKKISGWTSTLEFYSGYKLAEILSTVHLLNDWLHRKQKSPLTTVKNKYSHKIFFEVAKTPLLTNVELTP